MLISLITIRLELALEAPKLKFFQSYTAKETSPSSKTYASVTKSGVASYCDLEVGSPRDLSTDNPGEKEGPGLRHLETHSYDNPTCQGERKPIDITIESVNSEEWQNILMQSEIEEAAAREKSVILSEQGDDVKDDIQITDHVQISPRQREDSLSDSEFRPGSSGSHAPQKRAKSMSPTTKMPSTVNFFCGNPSVELTKGILHIYKDSQMTTLDKDVTRSEMLCMLGVPASYTIHDLIQFVAPMGEYVKFMQVLRDAFPNQYLLLIKFRDQESADDFYSYFNNRPFNSIEPDICHLVYVVKIEVTSDTEGGSMPLVGLTELPNCPVCLEKMEESVDGILTVLCNHTFHTHCLAQWGDTSCPVCRYIQTPEVVEDQRCMQCGSHDSLWICLICGNVGCGRYVGLHAYKHFQDTNHTYSMQLGTSRVWDYAGDNYVHRLAQNKSDGKLVQVDEGGNVLREEKLDSITLEYTYLLTTQLESQRQYFMEQISLAVKDVEDKLVESTQRFEKEREDKEEAESKLSNVKKEKQTLEKKFNQLHTRTSKCLQELQEERQMNKCLRENQLQWQVKVTKLEADLKEQGARRDQEVSELQEQLRDVMFYLEAQQKLASSPGVSQEELQEGQVIVGAAAPPPGQGKRSRRKPQR